MRKKIVESLHALKFGWDADGVQYDTWLNPAPFTDMSDADLKALVASSDVPADVRDARMQLALRHLHTTDYVSSMSSHRFCQSRTSISNISRSVNFSAVAGDLVLAWVCIQSADYSTYVYRVYINQLCSRG